MTGDDGPNDNVLVALRQIVLERSELERREAVLVRRARNEGFVWEQIADCLGVSRQAVHKKHAGGLRRRRERSDASVGGSQRQVEP